jgi:arginine N-succinyltransferase
MLPDTARAAIGLPHPSGRAAMRMLEHEGFRADGYLDIFDGGPTMTARTDQVRSIRDARLDRIAGITPAEGEEALIATGHLADFRCTFGTVAAVDGGITLSADAAATLDVAVGDSVWQVGRW